MVSVLEGRERVERAGFSYLPRFFSAEEATQLDRFFGSLTPLWEQRHVGGEHGRSARGDRLLTRPVYWLGAWQFACLGYYAEPHYREGRCLRAEPFPPVMNAILERLRPCLAEHEVQAGGPAYGVPNTCLINYYGSRLGEGPPVDQARLRMHQDGEPGPVVMFSVGSPGLLEFVEPERPDAPVMSIWTRHRSVVVFSGDYYKDTLYHRIVRVRHGTEPKLHNPVPDFQLRRVSVSFRHVPEGLVTDFDGLPVAAQRKVRRYVEQLARHSPHYAGQLARSASPATDSDHTSP